MKDLVEFNLAESQKPNQSEQRLQGGIRQKEIAVAQAYADDISVISPSGLEGVLAGKFFYMKC